MTLQSSGAISMNDINVELGKSGTATLTLNDSDARTLAGISSGAIRLSDFYGKSSSVTFTNATHSSTSRSNGLLTYHPRYPSGDYIGADNINVNEVLVDPSNSTKVYLLLSTSRGFNTFLTQHIGVMKYNLSTRGFDWYRGFGENAGFSAAPSDGNNSSANDAGITCDDSSVYLFENFLNSSNTPDYEECNIHRINGSTGAVVWSKAFHRGSSTTTGSTLTHYIGMHSDGSYLYSMIYAGSNGAGSPSGSIAPWNMWFTKHNIPDGSASVAKAYGHPSHAATYGGMDVNQIDTSPSTASRVLDDGTHLYLGLTTKAQAPNPSSTYKFTASVIKINKSTMAFAGMYGMGAAPTQPLTLDFQTFTQDIAFNPSKTSVWLSMTAQWTNTSTGPYGRAVQINTSTMTRTGTMYGWNNSNCVGPSYFTTTNVGTNRSATVDSDCTDLLVARTFASSPSPYAFSITEDHYFIDVDDPGTLKVMSLDHPGDFSTIETSYPGSVNILKAGADNYIVNANMRNFSTTNNTNEWLAQYDLATINYPTLPSSKTFGSGLIVKKSSQIGCSIPWGTQPAIIPTTAEMTVTSAPFVWGYPGTVNSLVYTSLTSYSIRRHGPSTYNYASYLASPAYYT